MRSVFFLCEIRRTVICKTLSEMFLCVLSIAGLVVVLIESATDVCLAYHTSAKT